MTINSAGAYEQHAQAFLQNRDSSQVGVRVTREWARSLDSGASVIEIACGGGLPVTRVLIESGLRVWAIDSSPTLIAAFRDRFPDVPVQCDTVQGSDFFQRSFDAAIAIGLIFLLDEPAQINLLQRVAEILHPGAKFLFTAPTEAGSWTDQNTGLTCSSLGRSAYESALLRAGFRLIATDEDIGNNHYYVVEKVMDRVAEDAV